MASSTAFQKQDSRQLVNRPGVAKAGVSRAALSKKKGNQAQRPPITTRTFHCSCPTRGRVFRRLDNRFRARVPRRRRVGQGSQANRCRGGSGHVEGLGQAGWRRALTPGGAIAGRLPNTGLRLSRKTCRLPNSPSSAQLSRFPARWSGPIVKWRRWLLPIGVLRMSQALSSPMVSSSLLAETKSGVGWRPARSVGAFC